MSLRGILRGFGLKVGRTTPVHFAGRIEELTEHHPALKAIAKALLAVHAVLLRELNGFEKQVRKLAKGDSRARLLMTAPGVGPIVGLTYAAAIDDPGRFSWSKTVGAHFGLTPKPVSSGETDVTGRSLRSVTRACARSFTRPPCDPDPAGQGRRLEELGGEIGQAGWADEGEGCAGQEAGGDPAPHLADGTPFDATRTGSGMSGPASKDGAVLAAVNTAARRVPRWPAASVDRPCARRLTEVRPGRRNAVQPNRETFRCPL